MSLHRHCHHLGLSLWVAIAVIAAVMIPAGTLYAQTGEDTPQAQPPSNVGPELNPNLQAPPSPSASTAPEAAPPSSESSASANDDSSSQLPTATNLETGLPLRTTMSPLHWGRLSLLSFTAFEGYDTNLQLQPTASASSLTALQFLAIYSIQRARTSFNLQYRPYVWFTQHTTYKDFAANSLDLDTSHNFGHAWIMTLADSFRYSPELANQLGGAFSPDYQTATSTNSPFLALQRKYWTNAANIGLDHQLSQRSHLVFNLTDNFVRMWNGTNGQTLPEPIPTTNEQNTYGGGLTWTRDWSRKNMVRLSYDYRRQQTSYLYGNTNYHTFDVGYTRILKPTLTFTIQGGPGFWSGQAVGSGSNFRRTTAQGSVSLFQAFHGGGIAFSASRNANYSGVFSNSLNNRYEVSLTKHFFRRWNATATGSYIQQEFVGRPTTTGELAWGQMAYRLTHMWSIFGGYQYYHTVNGLLPYAPQHFASLGIRWAWEPELDHK